MGKKRILNQSTNGDSQGNNSELQSDQEDTSAHAQNGEQGSADSAEDNSVESSGSPDNSSDPTDGHLDFYTKQQEILKRSFKETFNAMAALTAESPPSPRTTHNKIGQMFAPPDKAALAKSDDNTEQSDVSTSTNADRQAAVAKALEAGKSGKEGFLDGLRKASRSNAAAAAAGGAASGKADNPNPTPTQARDVQAPLGADSAVSKGEGVSSYKPGDAALSQALNNIPTPKSVARPTSEAIVLTAPTAPESSNVAAKDAAKPFKGRGISEPSSARPSHVSDFDQVRNIWEEKMGVTKPRGPQGPRIAPRGGTRNLRQILSIEIFNVRELYSLRGLACLMVFMAQAQMFVGTGKSPWPLAAIGAQLFFVMSGFFIARQLTINETGRLQEDLSRFYMRRAMRILPMYYFAIAILFFWGKLPYPESFFTCLFNHKLFELNHLIGALSQYWTICVEIQFYLLFPLVLLATPHRGRLIMLLAVTALSVLATSMSPMVPVGFSGFLLLPLCGQFLLFGALAGYADGSSEQIITWSGTKCFLTGLVLQIALQIYEFLGHSKMGYWPDVLWKDHATISAISLTLLVMGLWRTTSPLLRGLFASEILAYFGRISYGFYLLLPITFLIQSSIGLNQHSMVPPILVAFVITLGLAAAAWNFLQLPIINARQSLPMSR